MKRLNGKWEWKQWHIILGVIVLVIAIGKDFVSPLLWGKDLEYQVKQNTENIKKLDDKIGEAQKTVLEKLDEHKNISDIHMGYQDKVKDFVTRPEFDQLNKKIDEMREDIRELIRIVKKNE